MATPDIYNPKKYTPTSCFFVDYTALTTVSSLSSNSSSFDTSATITTSSTSLDTTSDASVLTALGSSITNSFGPKSGTQFQTTSIVTTGNTTPVKVFAICDGQILIQPSSTAPSKVNIILKPKESYGPIKIKYFIYRGLTKSDLITETTKDSTTKADVVAYTNKDTQPILLSRINSCVTGTKTTTTDATGTSTSTITSTTTTPIDASQIGYVLADAPTSLDAYFSKYNLPLCSIGDYIGNFTGSIGLDVVLDYGDCTLDYQNQLFQFDITYARASNYILDTANAGSSASGPILKRYREYILQFMDAAAFWGSHISCGTIQLRDNTAKQVGTKSTMDEIYSSVLNKYQTSNLIYTYICEERGRSYSYYADSSPKKISFGLKDLATLAAGATYDPIGNYNISGWPIYIYSLSSSTLTGNAEAYGYIQYMIDFINISRGDQHISVDVFSPDSDTSSYPKKYVSNRTSGTANQLDTLSSGIPYKAHLYPISTNSNISCSNFLMINCNIVQASPLENYYNHLFPANIIPSAYYNSTAYSGSSMGTDTYFANYDRDRMVNLDSILNIGAKILNRVVIDTTTVKRRLFIAVIKENTKQKYTLSSNEYKQLNTCSDIHGKTTISTADKYGNYIYGSNDFSVYRGVFSDAGSSNYASLALINTGDYDAKKTFFQLGITDDEYTTLSKILPKDADNVFFRLNEIYTNTPAAIDTYVDIPNADYRKFKLEFSYEDSTGTIVPTKSINTNVYVYTVDGFYFFSTAYSASQQLTNQFSSVCVGFRVDNSKYKGSFGFDWLRIGDNGELPYAQTIVNGYRPTSDNVVSNGNAADAYTTEWDNRTGENNWAFGTNSYKALLREYDVVPTTKIHSLTTQTWPTDISNYITNTLSLTLPSETGKFSKSYSQYYISYLNLFAESDVASINSQYNFKPTTKADLQYIVTKSSATPCDFSLTYDHGLFSIPDITESTDQETQTTYKNTITVTCSNSFSTNKTITVWATPKGGSKQLAGVIVVGANDASNWTVLPVEFIQVKTAFGTTSIDKQHYSMLRKFLCQAYILPKIETYNITAGPDTGAFNVDKNLDGNATVFESTFVSSTVINTDNKYSQTNPDGSITSITVHEFLRNLLEARTTTNPNPYKNKHLVFFVANDGTSASVAVGRSLLGQTAVPTLDKDIKCTIVFANAVNNANSNSGDYVTLPHEMFHGLSLDHTFRDSETKLSRIQKYLFYPESNFSDLITENCMSYNDTPANKYSTWRWQWNLIKEYFNWNK